MFNQLFFFNINDLLVKLLSIIFNSSDFICDCTGGSVAGTSDSCCNDDVTSR